MPSVLFISNASPDRVDYFTPAEGRYFLIPAVYEPTLKNHRNDLLFGPVGEFDLSAVLEQAGHPRFDVVIYHADPAWGFIPRGLNAVTDQSVVILGDMHHLARPIAAMLDYVLRERPKVLMPAFTRQHAHWFYAAGFNQFVWEPSFFITPTQTQLIPYSQRSDAVVFCGSAAKQGSHSRRAEILEWAGAQVPSLEVHSGPRAIIGGIVNQSCAAINITMNGDFNMRCFEIIADGGLLIVDALSASSGFYDVFTPGKNCLVYENRDQLVDLLKAKVFLKQVAPLIIEESWKLYHSTYTPARTWANLMDALSLQKYANIASWDPRMTSSRARSAWLLLRIQVYEFVQELNIRFDKVFVELSETARPIIENDLNDLVRVRSIDDFENYSEKTAVVFVGRVSEESSYKYTHKMHLV